jgi:cytidine deaminase
MTKNTLSEAQANDLMQKARDVKKFSHSPYSKFTVGSAVLLSDGSVFTGTNIENASYGLTCCAERVAIFAARSANKSPFAAIAISIGEDSSKMEKKHLVPCGACRQVMAEFMEMETPVLVDGNQRFTLGDLLPHAFTLLD